MGLGWKGSGYPCPFQRPGPKTDGLHRPNDDNAEKRASLFSDLSRRPCFTVEGHRGRLMEKLNLRSTGDLVRFAIRNGFISYLDGRARAG